MARARAKNRNNYEQRIPGERPDGAWPAIRLQCLFEPFTFWAAMLDCTACLRQFMSKELKC